MGELFNYVMVKTMKDKMMIWWR